METLLMLAALIIFAIPVGLGVAAWGSRGPDIAAAPFVPYRPDGWPRGVQEEDPSFERSWRLGPGAAAPAASAPDDSTDYAVDVVAVQRPEIRRRR